MNAIVTEERTTYILFLLRFLIYIHACQQITNFIRFINVLGYYYCKSLDVPRFNLFARHNAVDNNCRTSAVLMENGRIKPSILSVTFVLVASPGIRQRVDLDPTVDSIVHPVGSDGLILYFRCKYTQNWFHSHSDTNVLTFHYSFFKHQA